VLVVRTDDGEMVAVSSRPAALPTSSVDNTVPRFDGTGGALQTSGVRVDDSNNVYTPGSFFSTASGNYSVDIRLSAGASGQNAAMFLLTDNYKRWFVGKESTAESGSDAGSNFRIWRYHDDGSSIGQAFGINRATGKVTIDNTGSTAGLEFGSSGPRLMVGTGGPSGISAPVGSTWRQTDANTSHGSLTGLLWNKVGTGTTEGTDWLVDFEGRWVDWTPTLTNITRGTGYTQRNRYTRSGKSLTFDFALNFGTGGSVSAEPSITLPVAPVSTNEKFFTALLRTTSTYSQGVAYQSASTAMTLFALGTAGALLGDIASVTGLAGSWASSGRIQVTGTYEIA